MLTYGEIGASDLEANRRILDNSQYSLKSAGPGIIISFYPDEQVASIQPAIMDRWRDQQGNLKWVQLPVLVDVPIVLPRGGGLVLTMPIQPGDECLVVIADSCVNSWWMSGGIQTQEEIRMHDLSDGFFIPGPWSQPRKISNYSMTASELRTEDGITKVSVTPGAISLTAATVTVNGNLDVTGTVTGGASTLASAEIGGIQFATHVHSGVTTGSGDTGVPV